MPSLSDLTIKIWADSADLTRMTWLLPMFVTGITTNPSLMKAAGVCDYERFGRQLAENNPEMAVSLEVLADDLATMERQAHQIAQWGTNVYVKIPVVTSHGEASYPIIRRLHRAGVKLNITALFTVEQAERVLMMLDAEANAVLSVFAGRIADTGRDPCVTIRGISALYDNPRIALLWASTREVLNVIQAQEAGADIITLAPALIQKLDLLGKDLTEYSRETSAQFYADGIAAGLTL
jgi:transaldolase